MADTVECDCSDCGGAQVPRSTRDNHRFVKQFNDALKLGPSEPSVLQVQSDITRGVLTQILGAWNPYFEFRLRR